MKINLNWEIVPLSLSVRQVIVAEYEGDFWVGAPYSLIDVSRRFRVACFLNRQSGYAGCCLLHLILQYFTKCPPDGGSKDL